MIHLGLTGYPLGHSLSPKLHGAAFKAVGLEGDYQLFPIPPEEPAALEQLLGRVRSGELQGLNVTIPHKQTVIPMLDELSPTAQAIGAVNTVVCRDGRLWGENTDAPGFLVNLKEKLGLDAAGQALVLGAGGAARAVVYALLSKGWQITLAIRREDEGMARALSESFKTVGDRLAGFVWLELEPLRPRLEGVQLIVNTTPLGMSPHIDVSPWPDGLSFPSAALYDVVYNPRETLLVRQARAAGLRAETGLGMLVAQAALSFETWTGRVPPRDLMLAAAEA